MKALKRHRPRTLPPPAASHSCVSQALRLSLLDSEFADRPEVGVGVVIY